MNKIYIYIYIYILIFFYLPGWLDWAASCSSLIKNDYTRKPVQIHPTNPNMVLKKFNRGKGIPFFVRELTPQ
jgi:hypothetical protein